MAKNIQVAKKEFDDNQWDIDKLYAASPDTLDLDEAVRLKNITQDAQDAIKAAVPDYQTHFERAINPEGVPFISSDAKKAAYRNAFKGIMAKAHLENPDAQLLDPNGDVVKGLNGVLKFKVGVEGMKGRNELLSAVGRLGMLKKTKGLSDAQVKTVIENAYPTVSKPALVQAKKDITSAEGKKKKAEEAYAYLDANKLDVFAVSKTAFESRIGGIGNQSIKERLTTLEEEVKSIRDGRDAKNRDGQYAVTDKKIRDGLTADINTKQKEIDEIKLLQTKAVELLKDSKEFADAVGKMGDAGMDFVGLPDVKTIIKHLAVIDPSNDPKFAPNDLKNVVDLLDQYVPKLDATFVDNLSAKILEHGDTVTEKKRDFGTLEGKSGGEKLTDAQAAKKLMMAIIEEQTPGLSLVEKDEVAHLTLMEDVELLRITDDYETLAKEASASKLSVASVAGFRDKVLSFAMKEAGSDKVVEPLKGFKPGAFEDWASIEKLFNSKQLDHQNGFVLLAALEIIDRDETKADSVQKTGLKKRLKLELAKNLDVDKRMNETGVNKIVNDAFDDQMKLVMPLMERHFKNYAENAKTEKASPLDPLKGEREQNTLEFYRIQMLNKSYEVLMEEKKRKKVGPRAFKKRLSDLKSEAEDYGLQDKVDFNKVTAIREFWDTPEMQKVKDFGVASGKVVGGKALSLGVGVGELGVRGLWGGVGLGASLFGQVAAAPFRLMKYPAKIAAQPLRLFSNRIPTLSDIAKDVSTDFQRVTGYFGKKASETWTGAKENTKKVMSEKWAEKRFDLDAAQYEKRTKINLEEAKLEIEELRAKSKLPAVEITKLPYIDLATYKAEIGKIDKFVTPETQAA